MPAKRPDDLVGRLRSRLMDIPDYNNVEDGVALGEEVMHEALQDALEDFNIETTPTTYTLKTMPARSILLDYALARVIERLIFVLVHNDQAYVTGGEIMLDSSRKIQVLQAMRADIYARASKRAETYKTAQSINRQLVSGLSIT
ncbi:MAG: hypothetical protein WC455_09740 [Dehalococcoidia bacterium]